MRVLIAAPYIFISGHKQASRNQSGLAYMIRDIADMVSENGVEVDVLTQSIFTREYMVNNWRLYRKNIYDVLTNIKMFYLKKAWLLIKTGQYGVKMKIRILIYFLTAGYMEKILEDTKPDVVHIHGIGLYTLPFLYASARKNVKIIVTLHGLNSFNTVIGTNALECKIEKEFLQLVAKRNLPTTVISSGIKQRIETYLEKECSNIITILNCVKRSDFDFVKDCNRENSGNILCVGSLSKNKNQIQVLNAYKELSKENDIFELTIIGDGECLPNLKEYAENNKLEKVTFTGRISRDEVQKYYNNADLVVLASIEEGFGLPIIEAYSHGVPVVAFSDLDAIPDLYDPKCMVLVNERTTMALANGIQKALKINWDTRYIKKYSEKFYADIIGRQYFSVLSEANKTNISEADIDKLIF